MDNWLTAQLSIINYQLSETDYPDKELAVAQLATHYLADKEAYGEEIEKLTRWCIRALTTEDGQTAVRDWVSFCLPHPINHANLVPIIPVPNDKFGKKEAPHNNRLQRESFKLTDLRMSARQVQSEINYCIYCHAHGGDFCSKGFPKKKRSMGEKPPLNSPPCEGGARGRSRRGPIKNRSSRQHPHRLSLG
ncbi:conserved hypothetical protein [Beggiatoa sp. PS]|nr:conserved hypothetical protein [Beggiatoa sp. PS]